MKSFALVAALSFLFIACEDNDIPQPPYLPMNIPDVAELEEPADEPEPVKPEPAKPEPAKPVTVPVVHAAAKSEPPPVARQVISAPGNAEQLSSGRYTIQVAVLPSEKSAKAIVNRLASNGIKAYTVKVNNPAKLMGSYHRVRVGYFNEKTAAENFAKSSISSLGYDWWVDRSANDR